jgi:hypothetical protein
MPKSKLRKGHKERAKKRKAKRIQAWSLKKKAFAKEIEAHQKLLEEQGKIQEVLKQKNKTEEE